MTTIARPSATFRTLADLLEHLGGIPPSRVRFQPTPGTATERDVIAADAHEDRLCELVDGVLVEKGMGFLESRLAAVLIYFLEAFLRRHELGIAAGEGGMMRLAPGQVRIPDVCFVSWDRFPGRRLPREPIPDLVPDLAVEVLSVSNTAREMERKLREYFEAGVRLVWYVEPDARSVRVYTAPGQFLRLGEDQTLDGGTVLPGFQLSIREWFAQAEGQRGAER